MNTPSIKALKAAFPKSDDKTILMVKQVMDNEIPPEIASEKTQAWVNRCYFPPKLHDKKMDAINNLLEMYGVEYTARGKNKKSPPIEYCNAGDTYNVTILFVNGRYRIGDWGSIVERGNYD